MEDASRVQTKTDLHSCGSVSECQGVLPAHLDALLPDSQLLGNCSPPSVNPRLVLPVDLNNRQIKQTKQCHEDECLPTRFFGDNEPSDTSIKN
jgi:hypothetical protein